MQVSEGEAAGIAASRDPRFAQYRLMPEAKRAQARAEAASEAIAQEPQKQPVSNEHRDMLKGVAGYALPYVRASQAAFYGIKGDERNMRAFHEHFPALAKLVSTWNEQVAALEAERRELRAWVEERLQVLAYDQPPFAGGWARVISSVAELDGAELPFHLLQLQPLWLHLGSYPVIPDPPPNGRTREGIEDELRAVLSEAVEQPQRERIRQMVESLPGASDPLIKALELIQAKDVINGLGDCVLCR
ncbi:MAG TPA: hypothetical protein VGL37_05375 [Solirubrobacteraceae bacterium]|jgi:hypothetical protein